MNPAFEFVGRGLARFLSAPRDIPGAGVPTPRDRLERTLAPGDVLLVEGSSRISTAIKYLTQSTWSHVALYVGPRPRGEMSNTRDLFVEADLVEGVRGAGLDAYDGFPTRICRAVGLSSNEVEALVAWTIAQIGRRYDLRNVIDLARYLLPTPPVPSQFRRRLLSLGSGDPTRAICSTLVAEAFETIGYPILPGLESPDSGEEQIRLRHHSLYAPRDFDVSPYFAVVKPTLEEGFDFHRLRWAETASRSA